MKFSSLVLFLVTAGCATGALKRKAISINAGDFKETVVAALGPPDDRQFHGDLEAMQWCETGQMGDDYLLVWFNKGQVTGTNTYSRNDFIGSCTTGIKQVRWEQAPTATIEVRKR